MTKIGILSDTHGYLDTRIMEWFQEVDEIWHAGDIGTLAVFDEMKQWKPIRAVFGNIDGQEIRSCVPEEQLFECGDIRVLITHIGGIPGKYHSRIRKRLTGIRPGLFVCGHSHILKVMYDESLQVMYMNPGAAGRSGIHQVRTALRFNISKTKITELEVLELARGH